MIKVAQMTEAGGPEVLGIAQVDPVPLRAHEVRVRTAAAGVNFIDLYLRRGLYPTPHFPFVLGVEGAGVVEDVGPDVTMVEIGDPVAYAGPPVGSYATARVLSEARLIRVPDGVELEAAAGGLLRGLTAHMLLHAVRPLAAGDWVLVHAGAGGLGQMLIRWARSLGARVVASVGSPAKVALAAAAGAEHVLLHPDPDLAEQVKAVTGGAGVDVAYDGLGGTMLRKTFDCVRPFGTVVSLGEAAGPIPAVRVEELGPGRSLSPARPSVMAYAADTARYRAAAQQVLARLQQGLPVEIGARYSLNDVAQAHRDLEAGRTTGSIILTF